MKSLPSFALFALAALTAVPALAQRDLKNIPNPDPEEERKTFVVPEGFEVNLYAADPLLAKPIQMNFDAQGRLWIASSEVYPQIKPGQEATDKILVLEDTNRDGQADKTEVFADGLLIPTGIIPDNKGGCYVVNSTDLLHYSGAKKQPQVVLSGFGTEDTHHLLHTLRWGPDGCLYMNQSIYIHSHVETPYGVKRLNGGGIWRFRPETLELEVLAYGLVNSWGHHADRFGQSFATDGAGGEGINFVFPGSVFVSAPGSKRIVAGLNPGSPKHCGLEIISGRHLPPEWDGTMVTNDFRAHRVCRFTVSEDGSGYASKQETELIKTPHVAFRPIDVKMGPDGAIYIADWYNPIIQHGEVDFRDERRDHTHGRIWRVTAKKRPLLRTEIAQDTPTVQLLELLKTPEEWVRQHAKTILKNRHWQKQDVLGPLGKWTASLPQQEDQDVLRLEALWLYEALDQPQPELLASLLRSSDGRIRAAAVRTATHWRTKMPQAELQQIATRAANDEHPRVRLEAVRTLSLIPNAKAAETSLVALNRPMDRFLDFALWTTMRDLADSWIPALQEGKFNVTDTNQLTFALKAVDSPEVVAPLLKLVEQGQIPADRTDSVLAIVASLGGPQELSKVFDMVVAADGTLAPAKKAALLDTLRDTSRLRKVQPAGDLARLSAMFSASDEKLRAAAVRAAGQWKVPAAMTQIASLAQSDDQPATVRQAAIEALALAGGPNHHQLLARLAGKGRPLADRQQALAALAALDVKATAQGTADLLAEAPEGVDPTAMIQPLLARQEGTAALTAALANQKLSADVAKLVIRAARSAPQPSEELISSAQKAGGLESAGWKLSPEFTSELVNLARETGNAAKGEAIFRTASLQCLKCHAIGGAGGVVGPDLVSIGASAQPDYLLESLIAPASKVKEGYHAKLVLEASGQVYTGLVVRETPEQLILRTAEDKLITLAKSDIEGIKDSRSLMPDGAVDSLTKTELVDLVRFLSELGKVGGQYTVGQRPVVRRWQVLQYSNPANSRLNRTSFDAAASDEPVFEWTSAYSRVAGDLPLEGLPTFKPHQNLSPTTFLRAQLELSTPGKVTLALDDAAGVQAWVDGKPQSLAKNELTLDLPPGLHNVTLAVDREARQSVQLSLVDSKDSTAKVQLVGGK
jgi:putative heme-binding domain-containing protein